MADTLQRFVFENSQIRGKFIRLDSTLSTILQQTAYPAEICELLSHTLCASALLSATLKYEGDLTIQFQSDGPLKMLVAKCDNQFRMRGTSRWDEESLPGQLKEAFEHGHLVITIKKYKPNSQYQSIVEIEHQSIGQALEGYFLQSEQLETRFWLAYDKKTQQAAGLLLQKLPGKEEDDEHWQHIQVLADTLTEEELLHDDNEKLLTKLFHEETIQLFEPSAASFYCPCNGRKMLDAISVLGEKEALELLKNNRFIEVTCEYCHEQFDFNESEVKQLFTKH